MERGVDTGNEALRRGFFVTGRSVFCSGDKEALKTFCHQAGEELRGEEKVILHGVAGPRDHQLLQAGHAVQELLLHVFGERRRDPVEVHLLRGEPLPAPRRPGVFHAWGTA